MSNNIFQKTDQDHPTLYQIRIKGHLGQQWAAWFDGFAITLGVEGDTFLTGFVVDQSALHGLLKKVRDLGMSLVSIKPIEGGQDDSPDSNHP